MNWLDRFIGLFSPSTMLKRVRNTIAARAYEAAGQNRRTKNLKGNRTTSANTDLREGLVKLRNRSRELIQNNPYARKAIKAIPANVIGVGIMPMIRVENEKIQKRLREEFDNWAQSVDCDFDNRKTFAKIQQMSFRAMLESGGVLLRRVYSKQYGLQIQVLEIDHLDTSKDGFKTEHGHCRQGIVFDDEGRRVGYYIWKSHPGELSIPLKIKSDFIPAADIIHLYDEERPGQLNGAPLGTASMIRMKDLDDYEDAQVIRQKVAACFSVFITSDDNGVFQKDDDGNNIERVEPGMVHKLKPGEQISFATPPPVEGYGDYTKKILQSIAAGYDTTYETLTGDLSNVNFSSGRMGQLEFQRIVEEWQELLLIPILCRGVWKWFMDYAKISGFVNDKARVKCSWTAPRREFIDPLKEIKALIEQTRSGLISWQEAVRTLGFDPDEIIRQMEEDKARFDKLGTMPTSDPRFDAGRGTPAK